MKARAHGDLSENAEYKYAKERQGFVSARLGQLKKRLGDLGMLNLNNIPPTAPATARASGCGIWRKNNEIEYKLVTTRGSRRRAGTDLDDLAHRQGALGRQRRR